MALDPEVQQPTLVWIIALSIYNIFQRTQTAAQGLHMT